MTSTPRKFKMPKQSDVPELHKSLDALVDVLERKGPRAVDIGRDMAQRGWKSSTAGSEGQGKGGHSDPTVAAALQAETEAMRAAKRFGQAWSECSEALRRLETLILDMTEPGRIKERRPGTAPGAGDCELCGGYASGTPNDRIKSGFGPRCYRRWHEYRTQMGVGDSGESPSRQEFMAMIREDIEHGDKERCGA